MSESTATAQSLLDLVAGPDASKQLRVPYRERDYDNRGVMEDAIRAGYQLAEVLEASEPDPERVRRLACDLIVAAINGPDGYYTNSLVMEFFDYLHEPSAENRERLHELASNWARVLHRQHLEKSVGAAADFVIDTLGDQDLVLRMLHATEALLRRWQQGGGAKKETRHRLNALVMFTFHLRDVLSRQELLDLLDLPHEVFDLYGDPNRYSLKDRLVMKPRYASELAFLEGRVQQLIQTQFRIDVYESANKAFGWYTDEVSP